MSSNYINLPLEGSGGGGGGGVTSLNSLTGALVLAAGPGVSIVNGVSTITISSTGAVSIGAIDSQAKSANALVLTGGVLYAQTADATYPGMVSTGVQSFAGNKTFTGTIAASNFSGSSSGTNTGDVSIGTANGLSILGQVLSLQVANGSQPGALSAADWTTFNSKQAALTFPIAVNLGGTGLSSTPANGEILIGNGANYTKSTITAGSGIAITNGSGSITITNSAVSASINLDGGQANSNYGGISPINCGGAV